MSLTEITGIDVVSFSPTTSTLEGWFSDAASYSKLKARVLKGELEQLSMQDRHFLFDWVARNGILQRAASDPPFMRALATAGIDTTLPSQEPSQESSQDQCIDQQVFCRLIADRDACQRLKASWSTEQKELQACITTCCDILQGLFCYVLLNTKTVLEIASLCGVLHKVFPSTYEFDKELSRKLVAHIQAVQREDKQLVWFFGDLFSHQPENLLLMHSLGLDPNWCHPTSRGTLLFSSEMDLSKCKRVLQRIGVNLLHTNAHGNNALEQHCLRHAVRQMKALTDLGLTLSDHFPYVDCARGHFPHNTFYQAVLTSCFLYPQKREVGRVILSSLTSDDDTTLREVLAQYPEFSMKKLDTKREEGKGKFYPQDLYRFTPLLSERPRLVQCIETVALSWDAMVPSHIFDLLPDFPLLALLIGTLEMLRTDGKKKLPLWVFGELSRQEFAALNQYLFEKPSMMQLFMHFYMKVKEVKVHPRGCIRSTHAHFVTLFIQGMKGACVPACPKKLQEAFQKTVLAQPKETVHIPPTAQVAELGRTLIVETKQGLDAFKILKPGEEYARFSQEYSVSQAFREFAGEFQSQFIEPIGMYAVRKMPSLTGEKPRYIFHYRAIKDTFLYLHTLSEDEFHPARKRTLQDGAKMISMGVYPDSALNHDRELGRGYILLLDLLVLCNPHHKPALYAGGAGMIEQPFFHMQYPNQRLSGWTDLRDASVAGGEEPTSKVKDMKGLEPNKNRYFLQMHALSLLLLEDALRLAGRYRKRWDCDWEDEEKMIRMIEPFAQKLLEGFAIASSSYSKKPYEQWERWAYECGIDWTRAALQIAFWLDNSPSGYPAWIMKGSVPKWLYTDTVHVHVDALEARNFHLDQGFHTEGKQDLGVSNGPLALAEFEKAMHLLYLPVGLHTS